MDLDTNETDVNDDDIKDATDNEAPADRVDDGSPKGESSYSIYSSGLLSIIPNRLNSDTFLSHR